jgi:hypothetical protein
MLRFLIARGHAYTLRALARLEGTPRIECWNYDYAFARRTWRGIPTVFTDIDRLSAFERELAGHLFRSLREADVRVYNDPSRVKTRFALLRALHEAGINDFNAYRVEEKIRPARFPVFLRRDAGHGHPLGGLLADPDAAGRAVESALAQGIPESALLLVEYCAEPIAPGIFCKHNVMRAGKRMQLLPAVYQEDWLVKYGTLGLAPDAVYRAERDAVAANVFPEVVEQAFEIAHIDYGRIDYGLAQGRVQVYEINTNPKLGSETAHPNADRVDASRIAQAGVAEAIHGLGADASTPVPRVRIKNRKLGRRLRRWSVRSRIVP